MNVLWFYIPLWAGGLSAGSAAWYTFTGHHAFASFFIAFTIINLGGALRISRDT